MSRAGGSSSRRGFEAVPSGASSEALHLHQLLPHLPPSGGSRRDDSTRRFLRSGGDAGRLDLAGRRIVEFPTMLEVRMLGRSKMKVLRTIAGHLRLLTQLAGLRLRGRQAAGSPLPRPAA